MGPDEFATRDELQLFVEKLEKHIASLAIR